MQRLIWTLCCSLLLLARVVHAQDQEQASTLHVQANLVVLDVVVTDSKGKVVSGLSKDNFNVFQNEAPQTILNFESWTERPSAPATPQVDRFGHSSWGESPLTIFVLDELNTPFDEKSYAAAMLKKYLKSQPALLPMPAMLMTVTDYGYHSLQDYTRNRDLLLAKLDGRPAAIPTKLSTGQNTTLLRKSFAMLRQIAIASEGFQQHKNIVWIGRGFPGLDPASLSNNSQTSLQSAIKDTVTLLLNARVTVYKVDPMPTTTQLSTVDPGASLNITGGSISTSGNLTDFGETPLDDNFNFNSFAVSTGGQYFYGLNDLDRFIDNSFTDGSKFYTIAYQPPSSMTDGTFQTIKIKLNKPGLTAVTRQGYYAQVGLRPEPTKDELGFDLGQAAVSDMRYDSVGTEIVSVNAARIFGAVTVTLHVKNDSLQWNTVSGGSVANLILTMVALDAKHQIVSSSAYKLHPFIPTADSVQIRTGMLTVRDDATVNSKARYLRVLVRDSSGRIGTADVDPEKLLPLLRSGNIPIGQRQIR